METEPDRPEYYGIRKQIVNDSMILPFMVIASGSDHRHIRMVLSAVPAYRKDCCVRVCRIVVDDGGGGQRNRGGRVQTVRQALLQMRRRC